MTNSSLVSTGEEPQAPTLCPLCGSTENVHLHAGQMPEATWEDWRKKHPEYPGGITTTLVERDLGNPPSTYEGDKLKGGE